MSTPDPAPAVQPAEPHAGEAPKPAAPPRPAQPGSALPKEIGGAPGPEPTRYGDWQHKGRCTDF